MYEPETYTRTDGLFGWRLVADNGQVVATDGGQGYTERSDAAEGFLRVAGECTRLALAAAVPVEGGEYGAPLPIEVREAP